MTRAEYLAELEQHLRKLPKHDFQEALDYFTEYFDEAGPENEADVIAELGSPEEAARDIIQNVLGKQEDTRPSKPKRSKQDWAIIIGLGILASPLLVLILGTGLGLLVALLLTILSLLIAIACLLGTGFIISACFILLSFATLAEALMTFSSSWSALAMGVGCFFAGIGVAILIFLLSLALTKRFGRGVMAAFKWLLSKFRKWGKRHAK